MKNSFFLLLFFLFFSCKKVDTVTPLQKVAYATTSVVLEAELALLNGAVIATGVPGATGTGFVDYKNLTGDYVEWTLNTTSNINSAILNFRYANGRAYNRPLELKINGVVVDTELDFPPTGNWTTWSNALSKSVELLTGANKVRLTATGLSGANIDNLTWVDGAVIPPPIVAHPDHIIFVWLENHGFNQIIGSKYAPYINSLRAKGTLFTNSFALTHPSYPNYIDFFSGANQGVTANVCYTNTPFSTPNLYTQLKAAGKSFAWYSEDLPATGSTACSNKYYTVSHNPTTAFSNVPASQNKMWSSFPTDYTKLENVVCISPNKMHDMHDGTILTGDTWIKNNLGNLAEWCRTHNSIFVVYMDEDEGTEGNRVPVIAIGEHIKSNFQLNTHYDHFNWCKTICGMFNASQTWTSNLNNRNVITGCWN